MKKYTMYGCVAQGQGEKLKGRCCSKRALTEGLGGGSGGEALE